MAIDRIYEVTCDWCGAQEIFEGRNQEDAWHQAQLEGWWRRRVDGEWAHYCEDHSDE